MCCLFSTIGFLFLLYCNRKGNYNLGKKLHKAGMLCGMGQWSFNSYKPFSGFSEAGASYGILH